MVKINAWGRLAPAEHTVIALTEPERVAEQLRANRPGLAHGMGRSYGDVALNPGGLLWRTTGLDHFISFDPSNGRLECEAGVLLRDIQRLTVPRGWMLPVTPGTQLVTVGGAIANDVHGKNHHAVGSFGDHILGLRLVRTDGSVLDCGPEREPGWFAATIGGMGLTGVVVQATLQLRRVAGPWVYVETIPYRDLEQFFQLADDSEALWEHTVSWIDCSRGGAARGIFMRANACAIGARRIPHQAQRRMPFVPPFSLVNQYTLPPFNALYLLSQKLRAGASFAHYEAFNYPLDNLLDWNRMYGPKGFYQYQCVVPRQHGQTAVQSMLEAITASGDGSFLAILKTFGNRRAPGILSFPQPGVTLALDFPNHGERTERLFERLDVIVSAAGGRLYPAKDARMPRAMFEAGYPRLPEFLPYRDPGISSSMSRRLIGD